MSLKNGPSEQTGLGKLCDEKNDDRFLYCSTVRAFNMLMPHQDLQRGLIWSQNPSFFHVTESLHSITLQPCSVT